MATNTPLQSITLTSATQYVYFTNISQNYTDLIVVASVRQTTANQDGYLRFNGDNSSIYADQVFRANGSAASATKDDSAAGIDIGVMPTSSSAIGVYQALTLNVMNYTNTNMYKSVFIRTGNDSYTHQLIGTWRSTDAITSLSLESRNSGYFAAGSTFDLYGIKSGAQKATGGDVVVTDGTYWYHAFRNSGTFTPTVALTADVLVVAGGGGGGSNSAGGGGAGGVFYATAQTVATAQTITVGAGGGLAANGSNSTFASLTAAVGGGRGGAASTGFAGGSGGGGAGYTGTGTIAGGASTQTGTGGTGYGNAGGTGVDTDGRGGGGGGAGAVGGNSSGNNAGAGGAGNNTWSAWLNATGTGVSGYIAGGGGGGAVTNYGASGSGGGGQGGNRSQIPANGTANTGGGGGGVSDGGNSGGQGLGGSGLIIVRYAV